MNRISPSVSVLALLACIDTTARAQVPPPTQPPVALTLSFHDYLGRVARANLELAAQRTQVPIAEAQIAIARVFPDPVLTVGVAAIDVSRVGAQNAVTAGITVPLELGGKRGARIEAASSQRAVVQAALEEFYRTLRAEAAAAYVEALHARLVLERKERTLADLERLVSLNERRLQAGDVGEVAVVQARVEAQHFRGEVLAAQGELRAAQLALFAHLGERAAEPYAVAGSLQVPTRRFQPDELIARAQSERPDARARRLAEQAAQAQLRLAHANRWVDLAVNVGWQYNLAGAQGTAFEAPAFHSLGATLSVPLPLSRIYRGEIDAAQAGRTQAELQRRATELSIEVGVRQALARYDAAVARLALYDGGLLADADRVLAATLYNYQRGGASLLEVLNAQRSVNELYLAYFEALADHARGLIEVEREAGIWDVDF
jgi:cobalt-zinc-cadmium efflux system outer membrane protein